MHRRFQILITGLILVTFMGRQASAQYENVWVFNGHNLTGIDFNTGAPVPRAANIEGLEAQAMICDESGAILFYTNGNKVWNREDEVMGNGANLLELPGWDEPVQSSHQGTVIVPAPAESGKFYIFSLVSLTGGGGSYAGNLYYSIVNMQMNGGLGDVELNYKGIFLSGGFMEGIAAVVGDRCNIWLLARSFTDGALNAFEITAGGVNANPVVSPIAIPGTVQGSIRTSTHRKQLALTSNNYYLLDFDPLSGTASNLKTLLPSSFSQMGTLVPEFSSDNTKLYIPRPLSGFSAVTDSLFQLDITLPNAVDIYNSRIGITDSANELRAAPDGKIYFSRKGNIDRINFPNLTGTACGHEVAVFENMSIGYGGGPNKVAVISNDTLLSNYAHDAGCFTTQTAITVNDPRSGWDYIWNTGSTGTEQLVDTPGIYWVTYRTPPCTYNVDTFHVRFPNGVLPKIKTRAACRSDNNGFAFATTYPGDPVKYTFTWLQGDDTLSVSDTLSGVPSGSYSLFVQTDSGCDTLLHFDVPEEDFHVSFEVSDTLICLGDTLQIANTSDAHFTAYHWAFNNDDTSALSDPASYTYRESGGYRLMLAGEGAVCKDTAYQTILVDQPLLPEFEMGTREVCAGQAVYFYPATDSTTLELQWDTEEQLWIEKTIQPQYQHAFATSGTYPVTLTVGSRACPDTSYTDTIRVYPLPEVDLGTDSGICLHGQPIYLKNLREAPSNPYHRVWSTGDTTEVLKVVHPGFYTLSVTTEPVGCTTTETIEIKKDCYIDIPNAFTPNGDGSNDFFFPRQLLSESISRFHMQVFNRWGQVVFEANRVDGRGWDGRFNGKVQPMGVYLYRIEANFSNGRQEKYKGNVTLIR